MAADASSTIALLPGTLASAWAWRHDFQAFEGMLLWLLLLGTLAFAFGRRAGDILRSRIRIGPGLILRAQVVLSVYAGYFGGGIIMVMCFAAFGPVHWRETAVMLVAAVIGGYHRAVLARRVSNTTRCSFVIAFGFVMTAVFFGQARS